MKQLNTCNREGVGSNVLCRKLAVYCIVTSILASFHIPIFVCIAKESNENKRDSKPPKAQLFNNEESLYKGLFKQKRLDQLEAVKSLANTADFEKQYKMVNLLLKKIFEVLAKSKLVMESSGYIPGSGFPSEKKVQESLSHILENTAFFGDILLRLPDITHNILMKNVEWLFLINWCIGFSSSTELYDSSSKDLLNLVSQELNLIERDPHYWNPYRRVAKAEMKPEIPVPKEKKKKKPKPRGPQLAGSRHSEL